MQEETESESFQLEGRNAIMEALKADRPVDTLLVKKGENEGTIKVIIAMAKEKNIVIKEMTKEKLDELSITGKHQGIIAYCAAHEYAEIEDIFAKAAEKNEQPFIILLDGITDPHNLGAIIRTANAAGAHGIVIPKRRSAGLTAVVGKTSAGALQYVPVARVANITAALEEMKKRGLWIACADMDGDNLYEAPLTGALGLVIGGEGSGISRLVKEKCDFSVKIPMMGEIGSLNASVAASV
ncbi:MAG: 23S rRNA (guanosine(2251)-2'-O)-methyltransferase RlmB, partial [Clostridiales bacterium]|nr:23S rRNA (guanosine(2251)-2'-O)-methyltransferase RlmB [Clostridiales bacterium]